MADTERIYHKDRVDNDEKIVRFILYPRDWDEDMDELADGFVKLRSGEPGVSCVRHDYLGGHEATMTNGQGFAKFITNCSKKKNPDNPNQQLKGWGHCTAQQIIDIDPDIIFLFIEKPDESPEHVEIRFNKEGVIVKGVVKDAYILELFDRIEATFDYYFCDSSSQQVEND